MRWRQGLAILHYLLHITYWVTNPMVQPINQPLTRIQNLGGDRIVCRISFTSCAVEISIQGYTVCTPYMYRRHARGHESRTNKGSCLDRLSRLPNLHTYARVPLDRISILISQVFVFSCRLTQIRYSIFQPLPKQVGLKAQLALK